LFALREQHVGFRILSQPVFPRSCLIAAAGSVKKLKKVLCKALNAIIHPYFMCQRNTLKSLITAQSASGGCFSFNPTDQHAFLIIFCR